ncbi:hypothetical protein SS7213T_02513, partial [Staphylococcus simiae CCM 7213 = CCUG 51256]
KNKYYIKSLSLILHSEIYDNKDKEKMRKAEMNGI